MGCCGKIFGRIGAAATSRACILCRIWQILTREKIPGGDPCVVIPGRIVRKPDPCIYDQFLLMQLKRPVTWDSPDVHIFLNKVEQYTYNLTVSTEYDVEVTVHNSSKDKPANGTTVDIHWIEFGAGGQIRHPITIASVDVPVWPGTFLVKTNWTTPSTPGHYCIEIELSHPDDGNPSNNRGWNNTLVYAAQSPVSQNIRVFNLYPDGCPPVHEGGGPTLEPFRVFLGWAPIGAVAALMLEHGLPHDMSHGMSAITRFFVLMAAGYVTALILGLVAESIYVWIKRRRVQQHALHRRADLIDCLRVNIEVDSYEFADNIGKAFDSNVVFQQKAAIWGATVVPSSFEFQPGETFRDVELHVNAPDGPGPTGRFNVNVWQGGTPSGGVTVDITRGEM
jgi:hypothetical protein